MSESRLCGAPRFYEALARWLSEGSICVHRDSPTLVRRGLLPSEKYVVDQTTASFKPNRPFRAIVNGFDQPPGFPIAVVLGPNRSGKSTLCQALQVALGFGHVCEPRVLLRTGHASRASDVATADDAKPWVCRHIRSRLQAVFVATNSAGLTIDSPESVLKIGFLRACLPQAKYILLLSDDTEEYLRLRELSDELDAKPVTSAKSLRRVLSQIGDTHYRDLFAYARRLGSGAWAAARGARGRWRGLRYPGWEQDARTISRREIISKQRQIAVKESQVLLSQHQADWCPVDRFGLASDPRAALRPVFAMMGLQPTATQLDLLAAYYATEQAKPGWTR